MMYKSLNREQVLANCAFLFTAGVELITYYNAIPDPHRPRILQRQYHALVLQKRFSADGGINEHVLLRTSEAGLTSDAAIAILADEVERQIGEVVNQGGCAVRSASKRKIVIFPIENGLDPLPVDDRMIHEIELAIQAEDVLALEKARFDAEMIAEIEAHEAYGAEAYEVYKAGPSDEERMWICHYLLEDQQHDINVQNAINFEENIAHERAQVDDEIIAGFELYEAELNPPDPVQYPREHRYGYWRKPAIEIEREIEAALVLEEAEMQGVDAEKAQFEQDIVTGFEAWEAELFQQYKEHTQKSSTPPHTTPPDPTIPENTLLDSTSPDTILLDDTLPDSTPPDTTLPDPTPPSTESVMSDGLTPDEGAYPESPPPQYAPGATNLHISWRTLHSVGTSQAGSTEMHGSEATLALESPIFLYAPRRSRHVNAWLEGQYTRREQVRRKRAAVSCMEVSDADTMDTSSEPPELPKGCNSAGNKTARKRQKTQKNLVRGEGMEPMALDGEKMMNNPEPQNLHESNRTGDEKDQEMKMRLAEPGKGHGHKLDPWWNSQSIPTGPPSPALKRVYPHLADLSAHAHGLQPAHRTSLKAWVDAAKVHWAQAQRHHENGAIDSAYVDFLLACTIVAKTIPCFPSFAAARAAGRTSTVFVEFVELSKELKRNMACFINVREEIKRNNKASGVRSAAQPGLGRPGLGRGRGRGGGGTPSGLASGVLSMTGREDAGV